MHSRCSHLQFRSSDMRQIGLIIFLLLWIAHLAIGQSIVNNFEIENGIVWRKVFETNLAFDQLVEKIKDSGLFENLDISEGKVTGELRKLSADYKGAGYSEMGTPMYVARSFLKGFLIIEFKEGKYRVTIKNIILVHKYSDALSKQGEETNLDNFALKSSKQEFKPAFAKSPSLILDHTFTDAFSFMIEKKKDW